MLLRVPNVDLVTLDYEGEQPLYRQLAAILRAQIEAGQIAPGRPIPSKKRLCQEFEVSAGTAEHALSLLKAEGLIRPAPGKGLYVVPEDQRHAP